MANNGNTTDRNNKDDSDPKKRRISREERRWKIFLDVANAALLERDRERKRREDRQAKSDYNVKQRSDTRNLTRSDTGPDSYFQIRNENENSHIDLRYYDLNSKDEDDSTISGTFIDKRKIYRSKGIDMDAVKGGSVNEYKDLPDSMFQIIEEGDKRFYPCPFRNCDKVFPSLSRIKRHYVIHTNLKSFKCEHPKCGKRFSRKDNMLQHYRDSCKHVKADKKREEENNQKGDTVR